MKHCVKCYMPDTRSGSIFDENGVCQACLNYEKRASIDWDSRKKELEKICDQHRRDDGKYDCVIPVSGGKDSHFLVYIMKEKMGMNPLLITVGDPFTKTKAGTHNFNNLSNAFNCDHILFNVSPVVFRKATKMDFEERGEPLKFIESAIYLTPIKLATNLGISLIVYGENSSYEYGTAKEESLFACIDDIMNMFEKTDYNFWLQRGLLPKEINAIMPISASVIEEVNPNGIYMSYFYPWSSVTHLEIAKRYGFKGLTHEWKREGYIEDFEQIDSKAYLFHLWMKYPKFGFQRCSDIASRRVREGLMDLPEAIEAIRKNDHKLDRECLDDFNAFMGYSSIEFWNVVEKFWNRDIFEKKDDVWKMKEEVLSSSHV
jgi:N-acetyl sugar amidotransferase